MGVLSIMNLLTLLPSSKYHGDATGGWEALYNLGIDKVLADLYFTLPFDVGIIEARQRVTGEDDYNREEFEESDKMFAGEPYEVDREVSQMFGLKVGYLDLINTAKVELET